MKDAEANEHHKSNIGALKNASLEWEFEQIIFVSGKCRSVVESDFYTKLKKLDVQEGGKTQALRRSCDTGMRSAQSGDCVLSPAGVRRYEANHRGIEGKLGCLRLLYF